MTNQKLTKLICFGLVAIMSVTAFASCSDEGAGKEKETDSSVTTSAKDEEQSDADALVESLYGDRNYNGQKVRILALQAGSTWYTSISDTANEVWFEDAGSDVLQKSVYERNRKTQELINVEITPVWSEGSGETLERITQDVNAGVDDYDAAFLCIGAAMTAAQNGNTLNFNDVSSFDSSHEWWNQRLLEDCTFFGEDVYAVAGALNIWDDCATGVLLFNKNLLEKNSCTVPYQEVFDGTWTVDALMTRAKAVTQDLNGDTEYDENDSWGIGTYGSGIVAALEGFDSGIARMGSEGIPEIIANTEENIEKCQYWFDNVTNSDCLYNQGVNGDDSYEDMFERGQIGFAMTNLTHTFRLRSMEDDYGILPMPKYNAEQTSYTSTSNTAFCTAYVLPKNCAEPDMVVTCLEVMSGYSVNTLDYSLHDILFESKLTRDNDSREVLEIVKKTISVDWADLGDWTSGLTVCYDLKQGMSFTLASRLASTIDAAQAGLDSMIDQFDKLRS